MSQGIPNNFTFHGVTILKHHNGRRTPISDGIILNRQDQHHAYPVPEEFESTAEMITDTFRSFEVEYGHRPASANLPDSLFCDLWSYSQERLVISENDGRISVVPPGGQGEYLLIQMAL